MSIFLALLLQATPVALPPCEVREVRTEQQARKAVNEFIRKGYTVRVTQKGKTTVEQNRMPYSRMSMQLSYHSVVTGC